MSSPFIALFHRRLNAWRVRRLADRTERLELEMEALPISSHGPSYATLAEGASHLRRRLEALRTPSAFLAKPSPRHAAFQPSTFSATF